MIFLCYEYCGNWNNKFQKNSNQNSLRGLTTLNDILLWKFVKSCGSQRKFWDSKWIQKSECIFFFFWIFCHLNFISDEPCEKLWNLVGESFEAQSEFTNLNGIFFHLWRRALNTNYFAKTCWGFSQTTQHQHLYQKIYIGKKQRSWLMCENIFPNFPLKLTLRICAHSFYLMENINVGANIFTNTLHYNNDIHRSSTIYILYLSFSPGYICLIHIDNCQPWNLMEFDFT